MVDKRIYVVSLSTDEPQALAAGYKDGQLHIFKSERLPQNLAKLKESLPSKLIKLQKKGFIVLVDEVIPLFSQYGRPCRLAQIGQDGRPIVVSSLEYYHNMMMLQAITFPANDAGNFEISSSVVEEQRNTNGELVYHIDWSELRPETTCLLMCIHAATTTNLYDRISINALFDHLRPSPEQSKTHHAFEAVTKGFDRKFLSQLGLMRGHDE